MNPLILASTSRWRREMLVNAGIVVVSEAPGVDERAVHVDDPGALALALATAKAKAVAARHPDRWVLGADQVVHQDGEVFGKPHDPEDHLRRLAAMRGRSHELLTGWCLLGPGEPASGLCATRLSVRSDVDEDELAAYVACGEGSGCAGGYAIEGRGVFLFERIEGDWFNIVGLPLLDVLSALRARGWRFGA